MSHGAKKGQKEAKASSLPLIDPETMVPTLFTLSPSLLASTKERLSDPLIAPAYKALIAAANKALKSPPYSVTDKTLVPPSGDKHDYMSLAPYWWPDPSKPDGLPYIQRDGQVNPDSKTSATDSIRFKDFEAALQSLALAHYFTDDVKYAEKAVSLLDTWFLDPNTVMNPHLEYGQGIPGHTTGRGIGLIDTRNLVNVVDSIGLLGPALSSQQQAGLRDWFERYLEWLLTSKNGKEEEEQGNNHGTFYGSQVAAIALFLGKTDLAKAKVTNALSQRLPHQFDAEGKQAEELRRTRAYHYSGFNLIAFMRLAHYGKSLGVDIWHADPFGTGEPLLATAINWLSSFIPQPDTWPYTDLNGVKVLPLARDGTLPLYLQAILEYGKNPYLSAALAIAAKEEPKARDWLLWPVIAEELAA